MACALAGWLAAAPAYATQETSGFAVTPVRVDLAPGQRGATLTVRTASAVRKTLQAEVVRWSQHDGEDRYEPTRDLLVNPPLFFVSADAAQTVRIGPAAGFAPDPVREQAYRLYLQEVPPAPEAGVSGLRLALRVGIPVFVLPQQKAVPRLRWSAGLMADGSISVTAVNSGGAHERVSELRVERAAGAPPVAAAKGFRYLLPGARHTWQLKPEQAVQPGPARIVAASEGGTVEESVVLGAP